MKINISQKDKKLLITFESGKAVDKYVIDKAEDFLAVVDKFFKKHHTERQELKNYDLRFENTGILTERIVRSIISGLDFTVKKAEKLNN